MKLKLFIAMLTLFVSGCAVCSSREREVAPKTEVLNPVWGSQEKISMRANSKLRKGSAHGRTKMTKERTAKMLAR